MYFFLPWYQICPPLVFDPFLSSSSFSLFVLYVFKFPTLHVTLTRGVARNKYLGGAGCNRDILNMILKFIEYKIINFHISLYTWTCWEFNRNSKPVRNKKIEKKNAKRKIITRPRQYLRGSAICLRPQSCRDFIIIKENYNVWLQCFSFSKTTTRQNPNHKKKKQLLYPAHRIHNGLQNGPKIFCRPKPSFHGLSLSKSPIIRVRSGHQPDQIMPDDDFSWNKIHPLSSL